MAAKRSKFFRVAVEGATCDGRTLDRNALQEMADTYNPATYQARVNIEHIRGISAEPPFNAYGDVVALKAEEVDLDIGGKTERRLALFAQIDALENLIQINGKGQKLFSSVELNPNFAGTGKAYLQGLAVTDSPASLGTEILQFAGGQGDKNPFAARKVEKGNFFSAAEEATIEFDEAAAAADSGFATFFAQLKSTLSTFAGAGAGATPPKQDEAPAGGVDAKFAAAIAAGFEQLGGRITQFADKTAAEVAAIRGEVTTVKASIEGTDASSSRRPPATGTGSTNFAKTDC